MALDPSSDVIITPEEQARRAAMMGLRPPVLDPNKVQSVPVAAPNIQPAQGLASPSLPDLGQSPTPPTDVRMMPPRPSGLPDPSGLMSIPGRTGVKARFAEIGMGILGGLGGGGLMGGLKAAESYQNEPRTKAMQQYTLDRQHSIDVEGQDNKEMTDETKRDLADIAANARQHDTEITVGGKKEVADIQAGAGQKRVETQQEGATDRQESHDATVAGTAANTLAEKTANDESRVEVLRTKATQAAKKANDPGGDAFDRTIGVNAAKDVGKAQGADFRLRSMESSYPKAVKGSQQDQLNLLTNHLGMTMGLQPNARITQAILNEAIKSQPWLAGSRAKFDSRGYLSGVALGKEQMDQMMGLAKTQRMNAWQQANESAEQAGVKGRVKVPSDISGGASSGGGKVLVEGKDF